MQADYELALLASTYASLINAPLVVDGQTGLDVEGIYINKNVICVGDPTGPGSAYCDRHYQLEQLQKVYVQLTNTDKIILVNPDDLSIATGPSTEFCPDTSPECISNLYSETSLAAPLLASAKQELIVSTTCTDYLSVGLFIRSKNPKLFQSPADVQYLTIIASAYAIQMRKFMGLFYLYPIYLALDPIYAAKIFGKNNDPEVGVGRITGITISDVSSYISRVLFYSDISPSSERINMKFLASSIVYMLEQAEGWAGIFGDINYNAVSIIKPECCANFTSTDWENQDMIHYLDHGSPSWAGIDYNEIPLLNESLTLIYACATCIPSDLDDLEKYYFGGITPDRSFCANAIREGAIGYAGAVGFAFGEPKDPTFFNMLNNLYYYNYTTGKSFSEAYNPEFPTYMQTYIGDPSFSLEPPYLLTDELPFLFSQ